MSYVAGYKSRVLAGDFHLSPKLVQVNDAWTADMLDCTTFSDDGAKAFVPGGDTSTLTMNGFFDDATHADATAWKTGGAQALTWAPQGLAAGSVVWLHNAIQSSFETGATVSGLVTFDLGAQTDGITDLGVSLHDLTAETADGNGSTIDNSASSANGGAGHLHVTAFSGFSQIVIKIAHSTDNFSSSNVDLITFTTVTGVTSQRSTVTGTVNRYVRAYWTKTGSGSCSFQVGFARR